MLNLNETNVARHYDFGGFEYESVRLVGVGEACRRHSLSE
jgi:hypothetical protein